ncbi:MAG: ATP-binding protein [Elusimicrobiales bacterium]
MEYPPKAVREALVNAICHRDYRLTSKVQIRIFDDRIEFWNPGRLPEGWTVEKLKQKHESRPFNPLIAKAFFWIKYIEEVGTGTNKIIEWCKEWGLPEPDFEFTGTSMVVTLRKSKLTEEYLSSLNLTDQELTIIKHIISNKKITSGEVQKMFNVTRDTSNRYLNRLIDLGLLERRGKGRFIYYILKIK